MRHIQMEPSPCAIADGLFLVCHAILLFLDGLTPLEAKLMFQSIFGAIFTQLTS